MATIHAKRFPGESEQYRQARDELLRAELDLRRRVEEVAALRRRLPRGGTLPQDYAFEEGGSDLDDRDTVRTVRLSELFADKDVLLLYNFMFGPRMEKPCPMCSSFIDGLNANARHLEQRERVDLGPRRPRPHRRDRDESRDRADGRTTRRSERGHDHLDRHQSVCAASKRAESTTASTIDGLLRFDWVSRIAGSPPPTV